MNFKTTILVAGVLLLNQTNSMIKSQQQKSQKQSQQQNSRLFSSNQIDKYSQNNRIPTNEKDQSKVDEVLTESIRQSMQRRVNYSQQMPLQKRNQNSIQNKTMRQSKKPSAFKQSDQFRFSEINQIQETVPDITEQDIVLMEQNIDLENQIKEMNEKIESQAATIDALKKWKQQQDKDKQQNDAFKILTGIAILALIIMSSVALSKY